jgi:hypothetical protein
VSPYVIGVVLAGMLMASRRAAQNVGSASDLSEYTYVGLSVFADSGFLGGKDYRNIVGTSNCERERRIICAKDVLFVGAT